MKKLVILSFFLCAFFILGCHGSANFIEPPMPADLVDAVIIRTPSPLLQNQRDLITIKRIDGRGPQLLESKWVVAPGLHEVEVEIELNVESKKSDVTYKTKAKRLLEINTVAGHEYVVNAKENGKGLFIWMIDAITLEVVAGEAAE